MIFNIKLQHQTRNKLFIFTLMFGMSQFSKEQVKSQTSNLTKTQQETVPLPKEILLNADMAKGGEMIKTDQGKAAILFPSSTPVNEKIAWTIPGSMPPGRWQIDIDFYQPDSPFSPNQVLSFEGKNGVIPSRIDFYYIGLTRGTYTKSIGFYNSESVSVISLIKSGQRNLNTVAVSSIKISPVSALSLKNVPFLFQLSVSNRQILLPLELPSGVYVVNTSKPVALNWVSQNGGTFATPLAAEQRVFLDKQIQAFVTSKGAISDIHLTHYPTSVSPDMSSAGDLPLLAAIDSTKIETRTLKLIGYKGRTMPKLDLLPGGKTMTVVTSWDDGQVKDLQVMELLLKYGMKGTFFMNRNSAMIPKLSELEAKGMEVGSHSWSHPAFYNSTPKRCLDETVEMRRFLEKELHHPVISFAYPFNYQPAFDINGNYVLRSLRQAGYWSGRATSTGDNRIDSISEPLAMRPSFHFKVGAVKTKEKIELLLKKPGSILYIWGHSYELSGDGQNILEAVLASVANRPEVWYANLGELMIWQFTRNQLRIENTSNNQGEKEFILKMPALHPFLRQQVPLSLTIPNGVTEVLWLGKKMPVINGHVQLVW